MVLNACVHIYNQITTNTIIEFEKSETQTLHIACSSEKYRRREVDLDALSAHLDVMQKMSRPNSSNLDGWRPRPRPTSLQPRHQQQRPRKDSGISRHPRTTSWSGGGIFARSMSTLSEMSNGSSVARCDMNKCQVQLQICQKS